jgi:hypothetical protein
LQPTKLGNVLAARQDSAGRPYGFDAVTAWPRLYPVLGEQCRTLVDDRRGTLDASVRPAATMTVTAVAWEIDSPSPALPLPFIRERRIWGDVTNKDYAGQLGPCATPLARCDPK